MQQKTFYKILLEFSLNPSRAKQSLADKRMTLTEKKILEGHLLIRNNENQQAFQSMHLLPPSELPFVEGQRKLLMGLALNNLSHFSEAQKMIKDALVILQKFDVPYFHFLGNAHLFTIYSNQNQIQLMRETLDILEAIPEMSELQTIKLLRCRFDYYAVADSSKAREVLAEISKKKESMAEGDIISHLVCEFMFYVNIEEFDQCETVLTEMKKYRKFHLTENFNFMKKLLAHLISNAPIYLYGDDFKSTPMLYYQLKVIHAFEDKDIPEAEKCWNELQALYPDTYYPDFKFTGSKCLFSLCLDKHRLSYFEKIQIQKVDDLSQLDLLVKLLTSAKSPLSKGYIYEYLWGEPPVFKDDMRKLTRLISRVRLERGIEIKSRKGTYYIDLPSQKIKAG